MSRPRVAVLDYGSGNLRSAERALVRAGADTVVTADLTEAQRCTGLVVPGVGAFAACMAGLEASGAVSVIRDRVADGRAVLGICVGMQVMFDSGDEHGTPVKGLGLLSGEVRRLVAPVLPHMGWNTVAAGAGGRLFERADPQARYYFVHSYAAPGVGAAGVVSTAEHGHPFAAAVEYGSLSATQFHPEKSGDAGALVLANWVRTLSGG